MRTPEIITVEELERRISRPDTLLVDLRTGKEYRRMHIPGAVNIPYEKLFIPPAYRGKKLILYCNMGNTSMAAGIILAEKGYTVASLKGGMEAYLSGSATFAGKKLDGSYSKRVQ